MHIGLVTDSPSDIPEDLVRRYGIEVVPTILVLDGRPYLDGIEITRSEFYNRLPSVSNSPTTAAPSGRDFSVRFKKLLEAGCQHVIGIFTAEKLTAITDIARQAALDFAGKVTVLESGSLSMGSGHQVLAAARAIRKGLPLSNVLDVIRSIHSRTKVFAALDTVEYVRRSGRVPQAVGALGGLLNIKPVVELSEGVVRPLDAPRTTRAAAEKLYNLLVQLGPLEQLSILHTNAEIRANAFLSRLTENPAIPSSLPEDIRIVNVTTVIGTHVGPNGLGFAAVKNKP